MLNWVRSTFTEKVVSWKILLAYLLVSAALVSLINLVLFPANIFAPLSRATANLLDATLQANLLNIAVFCFFFFVWGKLRPADAGLTWRKLPQAIFLTATLWAGMQAIVLVVNWVNGDIHLDPVWNERGTTAVLGGLIGQLMGNAFFEELEYRGLYLAQLYLLIKHRNEKARLAGSILGMLVLFILSHIPNRIFHGYSLSDLPLDFALLFAWGLFFTAVYLLSGNLFLAIGVHALANRPTMITEASFPPQAALFILTLIVLVILRKRSRQVEPVASPAIDGAKPT